MSVNPTEVIQLLENGEKVDTFFLPCYMRLKVKNIILLSLDTMQSEINGTLIFTIYYGNKKDYAELIEQNCALHFDLQDSLKLEKSVDIDFKNNTKQQFMTFTIRKKFNAFIDGRLFFTPFEEISLLLTIKVPKIVVKKAGEKEVEFRFNLMDNKAKNDEKPLTISSNPFLRFGQYEHAETLSQARYTNKRLCFEKEYIECPNVEVFGSESFEFAHFNTLLYKNPASSMFNIFASLLMLAIFNLAIFFQSFDFAARVGNSAALMIAFVALVPTIRSEIPPTPNIVFIEYLIALELLASLLCLFESFRMRNSDADFLYFDEIGSVLLVFSFFLFLFNVMAVFILSCNYHFFSKPYYTLSKKDPEVKFNRLDWENKECEDYFNPYSFQNDHEKKKKSYVNI